MFVSTPLLKQLQEALKERNTTDDSVWAHRATYTFLLAPMRAHPASSSPTPLGIILQRTTIEHVLAASGYALTTNERTTTTKMHNPTTRLPRQNKSIISQTQKEGRHEAYTCPILSTTIASIGSQEARGSRTTDTTNQTSIKYRVARDQTREAHFNTQIPDYCFHRGPGVNLNSATNDTSTSWVYACLLHVNALPTQSTSHPTQPYTHANAQRDKHRLAPGKHACVIPTHKKQLQERAQRGIDIGSCVNATRYNTYFRPAFMAASTPLIRSGYIRKCSRTENPWGDVWRIRHTQNAGESLDPSPLLQLEQYHITAIRQPMVAFEKA